jgi:hypothetical protein
MMGMQDFLSPEQQRAIQQQSMMAMAAKLLQAGGPSTTPTSLGQAIGGAFEAGQGAMQSGQTNAVQQMLLRQKLEEAKDARAASERVRGLFTPPETQAVGAPLSPEQALLAGGAGRVGPTPQRQGLMTLGAGMPTTGMPTTGMPTPPGAGMPTAPAVGMPTAQSAPQAAPMGLREFAASLPLAEQQSLQAMAQTDPNGALKALNERFMTASSFGKPEFFVGQDGEPVAMQYNPFGEGRVVPGLRPSEPTPNEIKILRDLGLPVTLAGVTQLRQASAARQNVQVGGGRIGTIPPGFEAIEDPKTGAFRFVAIPGGPADIAAQEKSVAKDFAQANLERAGGTVVQDIGRVLKILGESGPLATGRGAVVGRLDPVSQASQIEDLVGSVRGNIGVDQLQQMRNASPTGGALGNVTERQLEGLQGLLGSLKVTGDKNILEDNLKRISNLYLDQIHGTPEQIRRTGPARGLTPEEIEMLATREELSFDVRGNPIGAKKTEQKKSLDQIFKPK